MYNDEDIPDKSPAWQEQGDYDDFFPNKPTHRGFIRMICQLQAFRVENLRLTRAVGCFNAEILQIL